MAVVLHFQPVSARRNPPRRNGNMRICEHGHSLLQAVNQDGWSNLVPETMSNNIHFDRGGISRVVGEHHFFNGRRLFVICSHHQRRNGNNYDQQRDRYQQSPLSRTLVPVHRGVLISAFQGHRSLPGEARSTTCERVKSSKSPRSIVVFGRVNALSPKSGQVGAPSSRYCKAKAGLRSKQDD
jgi:hypothetical protein